MRRTQGYVVKACQAMAVVALGVSGMGMGWVPDSGLSDPTGQNQEVSGLADQTMERLGFEADEAARYHDRLSERLRWGQAKGFFPTAFHISGGASAMALVGVSYDVGITVAPLPDGEVVLVLTRNRVIEAGPQAGVALRVAFSLLFNSDPLKSQSGDAIAVTADLGATLDVEATLDVGITRSDRELKNDLLASLAVGDMKGARADLRGMVLSVRPFAIGLGIGLDLGVGVGIAGGVGHETELARVQGRQEDLSEMIDALLRQAADRPGSLSENQGPPRA